mmetsp:Transcript_4429/g.6798  ORF Transcript_4429/g.6798 Transcript_4429/m.6798 type:complete len:85 (+) Transcript_4429:30-284(+)
MTLTRGLNVHDVDSDSDEDVSDMDGSYDGLNFVENVKYVNIKHDRVILNWLVSMNAFFTVLEFKRRNGEYPYKQHVISVGRVIC